MHLQEYPGECARALTQSVDLSHVFTLLRVDKFVIWEEFTRPWNWKIGKTGYQKNSSETTLGGGEAIAPPPIRIRHWCCVLQKVGLGLGRTKC